MSGIEVYWYLKLSGIFYDIADLLKAYKWALKYKTEKTTLFQVFDFAKK